VDEIDRDTALGVIERGEVAHVAVVDADGPYVSPVSYAIVAEHLVFITRRGRRFLALRHDPRICIEVTEVSDVGWRSALVEGEARFVTGEAMHTEAIQSLLTKYQDGGEGTLLGTSRSPGPDLTEVVAVPLDRVTGRSSGEGTHRRTRPGRL
jgi:nitroimidazol reductase NimA-like FMN-containing flavoprotein (pyridoxamine 5'-phosphate oxidase superfamily)